MKLYVVEIRKSAVDWCGCTIPEEISKAMNDPENAFYNAAEKQIVFNDLEEAKKYLRSKDLWSKVMKYTVHEIQYEVISIEEVEKDDYEADPLYCERNMIDYKVPNFKED